MGVHRPRACGAIRLHRPRRGEEAFGLVEVIIAIVILLIVLVPAAALLANALNAQFNAQFRLTASNLASKQASGVQAMAEQNFSNAFNAFVMGQAPAANGNPAQAVVDPANPYLPAPGCASGFTSYLGSPTAQPCSQKVGNITYTVQPYNAWVPSPGSGYTGQALTSSSCKNIPAAYPYYQVNTLHEVTQGPPIVLDATAKVTWVQQGQTYPVVQSTLQAPPQAFFNANDGYIDAQVQGIPGTQAAWVFVTEPASLSGTSNPITYYAPSSTPGNCAFFVNLPPGPGYQVGVCQIRPASNPILPPYGHPCQGFATATVTVVATQGTPVTVIPLNCYSQAVMQDGPLAYWQLNELTGTSAADSSGNGYNGTYEGSYSLGQPGSPLNCSSATSDTSVGLAGGGYVATPLGNPTGTPPPQYFEVNAFTVEAWVKISGYPAGSGPNPRIVANAKTDNAPGAQPGTNGSRGFEIWVSSGGSSETFAVGNGLVNALATGSEQLNTGQWYFLAGTYDDATGVATLYVDGQPIATANLQGGGPVAPTLYPINIGRNPSYNGDYLDGNVDQVAIYSYALSAHQLQNQFGQS